MSFNINLINPYIRRSMASILPKNFQIKQRIIFDYELIFIESGKFVLNYGGKRYSCAPNQFILIRPGVSHSILPLSTEISQPHIHFDLTYSAKSEITPISFKDLSEMSDTEKSLIGEDIFSGFPLSPFIDFANKTAATNLFYSIINGSKNSMLYSKSKLIQLIDMIITDNFPSLAAHTKEAYNIARQVKDYIDANQGFSAGLEEFEKHFSYSKYYLERLFKKEFGIGLITYKNAKRMEEAARLLQANSVSAVSSILGFSSIYVFSRAFKQYYKITPTEYKNSN